MKEQQGVKNDWYKLSYRAWNMKAAASERPKLTSNSEDLSYSECTWVHNLNGLWNLKTKNYQNNVWVRK